MNVNTLTLLLVSMIFFSVSWFPLLYAEIIAGQDDGNLYFVSMITNVCAMFIGICLMFILMRRVALDAL